MPDTKWDESDVERVLEWYEREPGDALIGEVARIQRAVHHRLELDRFDNFVAAYQRGT